MDRRTALFVAVILLLVGAIGVVLSTRFGLFVRPSPAEWTELDAFNQIVLEVAGEVTVRQSDRYAVRVDAPRRERARTDLNVVDETLFLRYRPASFSLPGQAVKPVRYVVEAADPNLPPVEREVNLMNVQAFGGSKVAFNGDYISINHLGNGNFFAAWTDWRRARAQRAPFGESAPYAVPASSEVATAAADLPAR